MVKPTGMKARMRRTWQGLGTGLMLSALAFTGCGDGEAGVSGDVTLDAAKARVTSLERNTEGVESTLAGYFSAFDTQDAEQVGSLFTPGAEVYFYDGQVLKRDQFITMLPQLWADWSNLSTTYHVRGETLQRSYGWAKLIAEVSYQVGDEGRAMELLMTFGVEQRGDKWLISHLQLSAAPSHRP